MCFKGNLHLVIGSSTPAHCHYKMQIGCIQCHVCVWTNINEIIWPSRHCLVWPLHHNCCKVGDFDLVNKLAKIQLYTVRLSNLAIDYDCTLTHSSFSDFDYICSPRLPRSDNSIVRPTYQHQLLQFDKVWPVWGVRWGVQNGKENIILFVEIQVMRIWIKVLWRYQLRYQIHRSLSWVATSTL